MDQSDRLNVFNTLFMICLDTPPDEVERAIMARAVRTTLKLKVDEVEGHRNDIIDLLKTAFPTYKDVKGALEELRRLRGLEKKASEELLTMTGILVNFGFDISEWSTTPAPLVVPVEAYQPTPPAP